MSSATSGRLIGLAGLAPSGTDSNPLASLIETASSTEERSGQDFWASIPNDRLLGLCQQVDRLASTAALLLAADLRRTQPDTPRDEKFEIRLEQQFSTEIWLALLDGADAAMGNRLEDLL